MMKGLIAAFALCLFYTTTCLALKPSPAYIARPSDYGMAYNTRVVEAGKARLTSWFCYHEGQREDSNRVVLICPGDFGNMSYQLPRADSLYRRGFDVILFDYRGFGESSAMTLDTNALIYGVFADDFLATYNFYKQSLAGRPINVLALSMGAIVVTLANERKPDLINGGLAFDGYIFSIQHTPEVLRGMKGRPFFANIPVPEYERAERRLFQRSALFFQGSEDLISAPSDYAWPQVARWTRKSYNGGHLQGMGRYVDPTGAGSYFAELDAFFRR